MVVAKSEYSLPQYLEVGQGLVEEGKFVEAIELYETALTTYPDSASIYQALGFAQEKADQISAGIISYRQAIDLDPHSPIWVYIALGRMLGQQDQWHEALIVHQQGIGQHPDQGDLYRELGLAQDRLGNPAEAILNYQQAVKLRADQPLWVYTTLGVLLGRQQDWQTLVQVYRQAVEQYPEQAELYRELGFAQEQIGDVTGEIESYRQAIDLDVQPVWVYTTLIDLLNRLEAVDRAIEVCHKGLTAYPDAAKLLQRLDSLQQPQPVKPVEKRSLDWYWQQAKTLCEQEEYQAAIEVYQEAIEQYPDRAELYRELGVLQERLGDTTGELDSYERAIALEPRQPIWVYTTLGHLLKRQARFQESAECYQTALQRYPDQAGFELYRQLGEVWTAVQAFELAIQAYQWALALEPDRRWVQSRIGAIRFAWGQQCLEAGDLEAALMHFQQVDQVQGLDQALIPWFMEAGQRWPAMTPRWLEKIAQRQPEGQDWPRITIVTPSLNQGAFIEQTIQSVLHQNYPNLEYFVVDGGSTDQTIAVLEQYAALITEVTVEPDSGQSAAINKGFGKATGDLLLWLNSDDLLAPGALYMAALTYLQQSCDVIAGMCLVHEQEQITGVRLPRVRQQDFTVAALADVSHLWAMGHFFFQPEVVFSRRLWQAAGAKVDESLHYAMDHDLWMRFAQANARLEVVAYPFAMFRKHAAQKTRDQLASLRELVSVTERYHSMELRQIRREDITQRLRRFFAAATPRLLLINSAIEQRFHGEVFISSRQQSCSVVLDRDIQTFTEAELQSFDAIVVWVWEQEEVGVKLSLERLVFDGPRCVVWCNRLQAYQASMELVELVDICIPVDSDLKPVLQNTESWVASALDWSELQASEVMGYASKNVLDDTVGYQKKFLKSILTSRLNVGVVEKIINEFEVFLSIPNWYPELALAAENIVAELKEMVTESIKQVWQHLDAGRALTEQGQFAQAIELYRNAIAEYPDRAELHRELGVVQEKVGDIAGEIDSYQRAVELDRHQPAWVYAVLISLLRQQQRFSDSISIGSVAVEHFSKLEEANHLISYELSS